jgi:putative Mn2+ efflux pump MntP
MIQLILLSFGLAMDAFSVSVSFGICHPKSKIQTDLRLAFFTALFQFMMPLIGWIIGCILGNIFFKGSNWIAFIILLGIGIKMIIDAIIKKEECNPIDISRGKHLIIICLATSIDALAAGLSLGILKTPLFLSVSIIGIITFILSFSGIYLGKIAGFLLGKWAEIFGGIILISIGFKIIFNNF